MRKRRLGEVSDETGFRKLLRDLLLLSAFAVLSAN